MQRDFNKLRQDLKGTIDVLDEKSLVDVLYFLSEKIHLSNTVCENTIKNIAVDHFVGVLDTKCYYWDKYDAYELRVYAALNRKNIEEMLRSLGHPNSFNELMAIIDKYPYHEYNPETHHLIISYYPKYLQWDRYVIYMSKEIEGTIDIPEKKMYMKTDTGTVSLINSIEKNGYITLEYKHSSQ